MDFKNKTSLYYELSILTAIWLGPLAVIPLGLFLWSYNKQEVKHRNQLTTAVVLTLLIAVGYVLLQPIGLITQLLASVLFLFGRHRSRRM